MADSETGNQQGKPPVDSSIDEDSSSVQYEDLIKEHAFIGKYPFTVILAGMRKQFEDYINISDTVNYVDVFFTQLHNSYAKLNADDSEEHPVEIRDILRKLYENFIDNIRLLFNARLGISIIAIEDGNLYDPELESIIRRLYEFFILSARDNFKLVIATDILPKVKDIGDDDKEFFRTVSELLSDYSPLVTEITPMRFLKYRAEDEITEMYDEHKVNGNFLKKYSPKLYMNEDFQVEIINYITMVQQFNHDLVKTQSEGDKNNE